MYRAHCGTWPKHRGVSLCILSLSEMSASPAMSILRNSLLNLQPHNPELCPRLVSLTKPVHCSLIRCSSSRGLCPITPQSCQSCLAIQVSGVLRPLAPSFIFWSCIAVIARIVLSEWSRRVSWQLTGHETRRKCHRQENGASNLFKCFQQQNKRIRRVVGYP